MDFIGPSEMDTGPPIPFGGRVAPRDPLRSGRAGDVFLTSGSAFDSICLNIGFKCRYSEAYGYPTRVHDIHHRASRGLDPISSNWTRSGTGQGHGRGSRKYRAGRLGS